MVEPKISVVIVNWNSKDYVRKCLQSLRATCSDLLLQIIVVDGASYDGCEAMLRSEFPAVEFVQSSENIGFGQCNNLGVRVAKGEYLLLLNPDCEVMPGAIQALLSAYPTLTSAGLLGPRLLNTNNTLQKSCVQSLPTPLNQALDAEILRAIAPRLSLWGNYKAFRSKAPVEVEAISGACMLVRTKLFLQCGGFSPEYFMYAEDMDLCAKMRRIPKRNYHVPEARVIHHGGGSSQRQPSTFSIVQMRIALETYFRLHLGSSKARRYRSLQLLSARIRLGLIRIGEILIPRLRPRLSPLRLKWEAVRNWCTGETRHASILQISQSRG